MLDIAASMNRRSKTWNVVGVVTPTEEKVGSEIAGFVALDMKEAMIRHPAALMVPEYEWPLKSDLPRSRLATLVDPSAFVSVTAQIGLGCVIFPHCYVGAHARVGDFLFCLAGTVINHNDIIEDHVTLTSGVVLAGDVLVEADCYLGQGCTVREMVTIGRGSVIGMGSVVLHDVAPNSVVAGNPARRLRARVNTGVVARALRAAKRAARRGKAVVLRQVGAARR
jgi:acetyltransferase-like isoleucine patch superfamily enzyme